MICKFSYKIKQEINIIFLIIKDLILNLNFRYVKSKSNNNCVNIPFLKYFIYTNT